MYHFSYSNAVAEGPQASRSAEREVLLDSIALMEEADRAGPASRESIEAVYFVTRLWCHLIEDLGSPENDLPKDLRVRLISIGLFMIRKAEEVRSGTAHSFEGMIEITRSIAEGLK